MTTVPKYKTISFSGMRYVIFCYCCFHISQKGKRSKKQNWSRRGLSIPVVLILAVICEQGKGTGAFEQCYYGPQKQYRLTKLSTASRYYFRLAAKNDMGARYVSKCS